MLYKFVNRKKRPQIATARVVGVFGIVSVAIAIGILYIWFSISASFYIGYNGINDISGFVKRSDFVQREHIADFYIVLPNVNAPVLAF